MSHGPRPSRPRASPRSPGRDRDLSARARLLKAVAWSLFPAFFMGVVVSWARGLAAGLVTAVLVLLVAGGGALLVSETVGRATASILHPGGSGRRRSEHSGAAALAAGGRYREAVAAYARAAEEHPDDPAPCLEAARILTGRLGETEEAFRWFREARRRGIPPGQERIVLREVVEAAQRGGNGLAAAPMLARYAEERAGTEEEAWARRVLAGLREELRGEDDLER